MKSLADVCQIRPPKTEARRRASDADLVSFVPMEDLGVGQKAFTVTQTKPLGEVIGSYTYFADGDVLLAKITPCFENGKLGIAEGLSNGLGFGSSEYVVFRPGNLVEKDWLYYFLSRAAFREEGAKRMSGAVGHKRVSKEFIETHLIPLPPRAEQKRIVAILNEAFAGIDTAIVNAEKNLASARDLLERCMSSAFDRQSDTRSLTVRELTAQDRGSIRTGPFGSQLLHGEFVDAGIAVLGIDNVVENRFTWNRRRYITAEKYASLRRYTVKPGDVLISIMGTCGRCAIVPNDIEPAINSKHLCCISLDRSKCLPDYLHAYFLFHPLARAYLSNQSKGSIMDGLNMGIIQEMPVLVPPLVQQTMIAELFERARFASNRLADIQTGKVALLRDLRQAILGKAFAGDLTAQPENALPEAAE